MKPELKYDEALKDSNLSDEDVLLLQAKDDDIVEDIQQSDVDILLSENEKENETVSYDHYSALDCKTRKIT